MARTWRGAIPRARSRPISRVRSNTDRARVLAIPKRATTIERPSSAVTNPSRRLIRLSMVPRNADWSWIWTMGKALPAASMPACAASRDVPAARRTSTIESSWSAAVKCRSNVGMFTTNDASRSLSAKIPAIRRRWLPVREKTAGIWSPTFQLV